MTINLNQQLIKIRQMDCRHNAADFYVTFDLQQFYSAGMVNMIISGRREAKRDHETKAFFRRCADVYEQNTHDYSNLTEMSMQSIKYEYEQRHHLGELRIEDLIASTTANQTNIRGALRNPRSSNKLTCTLYDLFALDLLHVGRPTEDSLFMSVEAYDRLVGLLIRAEIGNGIELRTVAQIAKLTGVSKDLLQNLSRACQSPELYIKTYNALVSVQIPYTVELK